MADHLLRNVFGYVSLNVCVNFQKDLHEKTALLSGVSSFLQNDLNGLLLSTHVRGLVFFKTTRTSVLNSTIWICTEILLSFHPGDWSCLETTLEKLTHRVNTFFTSDVRKLLNKMFAMAPKKSEPGPVSRNRRFLASQRFLHPSKGPFFVRKHRLSKVYHKIVPAWASLSLFQKWIQTKAYFLSDSNTFNLVFALLASQVWFFHGRNRDFRLTLM